MKNQKGMFSIVRASKFSNKAFTLAEVIVTMGIIGVLSALLIPTVVQNQQKAVLRTQFQKAYSEILNANDAFKARYNSTVFDYSLKSGVSSDKVARNFAKAFNVVSESMTTRWNASAEQKAEYVYYRRDKKTSTNVCDGSPAILTKGNFMLWFNDLPDATNLAGPAMCVDINGFAKPNSLSWDIFIFVFTKDGRLVPYVYLWGDHITTPQLTGTNLASRCNVSKAVTCSYYAVLDQSPLDESKTYWQDYLGNW